ncbi:bifunctional 3-oxoadipate enol-lactonase/4-carboxymuconolactone decarboxylase PcaDC [Subtercola frigoramans]|uniref:3-oxoadipate enol-lactonase/4-carboxymuconolactone decarboxylase n=1 Tax=Subtercola frigoramans TaxID=120298 RepID=A0ABS2L172_9MICO|nr:4-carboxymuconolactone decarboxylase [Subtercola frigoramans]MBM7470828.1 3-oxoadipate enol-lactonase/4-carboxymuconolactone decarboxylase [Subtercola frigoramans]
MTVPQLRCTVQPVSSGAPNAELLVLGPSLGTTTSLWQPLLAELSANFRVLRFDLPGHGASPRTREPFTMAELAEGVLALVDAVGGGAFHYAGVSMGGAIGLQLAVDHADRLRSLAVICSGPKIGTADGWDARASQVRASGTASLVASSAERWFAPGSLERSPSFTARALTELLDVDDESYALCCGALALFDVRDRLVGITTPALCIAGAADAVTTPEMLGQLAEAIHAPLVIIDDAGHLPTLERPAVVRTALLGLVEHVRPWLPRGATAAETYDSGMIVRREVLGDAHVDAANAKITPETADFQDFITRYAWGEIWSRPGLDRRTRSFLTLACLATGGHEAELRMHVRAALTNGLSRAEISEALMHTAVYAGVPAANSALAAAREVFAALDEPAGAGG